MGAEAEGDERGEEAALERAEAGRDQEGRDLDAGAERLDHGGGASDTSLAEEPQDSQVSSEPEEPGDEVEGDRERQPPRAPSGRTGRVRRRRGRASRGPGRRESEPLEQPARPARACRASGPARTGPERPPRGRGARACRRGGASPWQDRAPRHHDAQEEKEPLGDGDRRLGDDDRGEARIERRVPAQEPGLDRLAADGGVASSG